jgi:hypothetical protein
VVSPETKILYSTALGLSFDDSSNPLGANPLGRESLP